jgi:glycosyltransferase involved in cell wall biosynthesis
MINSTDKIGVLLSVYNGDKVEYFKQAINSILDQTYSNICIFVGVDGPVKDELKNCLNNYEKREDLRVFYFNENRGLAAVLNYLLHECLKQKDIEYIARMDSDDISICDRFEKQIIFLRKNIVVDVVGGIMEDIDADSKKTGKKMIYPLTHNACRRFYRYRDPLPHAAAMFRRSFFDKVTGYRNEYRQNQDTMLWFDAFLNGCILSNLNESIYLVRVAPNLYNRRGGYIRAKKMLLDRFMINKALHYDITSYLFAIMYFFYTLMPAFIKKWLYEFR